MKKMSPIVHSNQEINTTLSNPSQGSQSKIENQSIFKTIEDKLYLKINQLSYLVGLLTEMKEYKGFKINYKKLSTFLNEKLIIILNSPDIIKMISTIEKKPQNSSEIISDENTLCAQSLNDIQKVNEELSPFINDEGYFNFEGDNMDEKGEKEETKVTNKNEIKKEKSKEQLKDEENKITTIGIENSKKDELKTNIDEFLKNTKFFYVNDLEGPIKCDIELLNIEKSLKFFAKKNYFKDLISPKYINNDLYIPLPYWAYSINSFNLNYKLYIILGIRVLLNYIYYYIKGKIFINDNLRKILVKYKEIINKINNAKAYISQCSLINIDYFFSTDAKNNILENAINLYLKKNNNYNKEKIKEIFINILNNLEIDIGNYKNNNKKIKKLFKYIVFYSFDDILHSRQFIYLSFLHYLLNYIQEVLKPKLISLDLINVNIIIENLKSNWYPKRNDYISKIINLIQNLLQYDYEKISIIKYGSFTTGLDIIGSDIDLIIYYKENKELEGTLLDNLNAKLLNLMNENFEIEFISKASVPIIKLKYNILSMLNNNYNFYWINWIINTINQYKYLDIEDFIKIKIDISCTTDKKYCDNIQKMTEIIKCEINKNVLLIKPIVLYLKLYLKVNNMNSLHEGWLNSLAIVIMTINTVKTYINKNKKNEITPYEIFVYFLKRFSNYNYDYKININGSNSPCDQSNVPLKKKRFVIINPINNTNISEKSFKTPEIKKSFANLLKSIEDA